MNIGHTFIKRPETQLKININVASMFAKSGIVGSIAGLMINLIV